MRKDRRINTENLVNENDKGSKLTFLFDVNQKPKVRTESLHEPVSANFNSKTIRAEKSAKIAQKRVKNDIKRQLLLQLSFLFYANILYFNLKLSAIIAINSELVGFPRLL